MTFNPFRFVLMLGVALCLVSPALAKENRKLPKQLGTGNITIDGWTFTINDLSDPNTSFHVHIPLSYEEEKEFGYCPIKPPVGSSNIYYINASAGFGYQHYVRFNVKPKIAISFIENHLKRYIKKHGDADKISLDPFQLTREHLENIQKRPMSGGEVFSAPWFVLLSGHSDWKGIVQYGGDRHYLPKFIYDPHRQLLFYYSSN